MPWAPLRVCAEPGCRERQAAHRCPRHARISSHNHHGRSRQERGLGAGWEGLKAFVISRDGGRCQLRLPGCTLVATTADHILARARRGQTIETNLRASCLHCNASRGDGRRDQGSEDGGRGSDGARPSRPAPLANAPHARPGFVDFVSTPRTEGGPP